MLVIEGDATFRWTFGSNSNSNADDIAVYSPNRIGIGIGIGISFSTSCILLPTASFRDSLGRAASGGRNRVQDGG